MPENESYTPKEILDVVLKGLQSNSKAVRMQSLSRLQTLNYSSEAVRDMLETLALEDENADVRREALAALNLQTHRHVQSRSNKLTRGNRYSLLQEIENLEKDGLLDGQRAEVIRRRYDFDIAPPPPAPKPAPAQPKTPQPAQAAAAAIKPLPAAISQEQKIPPKPAAPAGPRPTLLQTLLSETSIKIALYLGAFFVIASAIILSTLGEVARLLVLIAGTVIFGGVAVAIRKRLPQPSFALFIVFSFLLPITASVIKDSLHLDPSSTATYWVFVFIFMAIIWSGSTWLYESRLFSITAFISLALALYRSGDIFKSEPETYMLMLAIAALVGLGGARILEKWKDSKFALLLFGTAQALQVGVLTASMLSFIVRLSDIYASKSPEWHGATALTWGLAFIFFVFSETLYTFFAFPWIAAATLIPIPWFISARFELDNPANAVLFVVWGILLCAPSEVSHRYARARKYSLPVLLASIPAFAVALFNGLVHQNPSGFFTCALIISAVYAALHFVRARGWLWALALFNFVIAYFAFFSLPFMEKSEVFFGYQLLGLSLIFLLPDLFLKKDLRENPAWRLPPRIYGAAFTLLNFVIYPFAQEKPLINTAVVFGAYALFFALYAFKYRQPLIAYAAALALPISIIYTLDHFDLNYWLEALTMLSAIYYFAGLALRKDEKRAAWRYMFRTSALILGSAISLVALSISKEHGGWSIAVIGALFVIEMYAGKQSLFEAGAHLFFPAALSLILDDFNQSDVVYQLFGFSIIWLSVDLILSSTYKEKRPLEIPVQILGAATALITTIILLTGNEPTRAAICFASYTLVFTVYALARRNANYGYAASAYLPLAIFFSLEHFKLDAWLPALTGLAVLYSATGFAIRGKGDWSLMLRNSALALGSLVSLGALLTFKETGGWYVAVIGLLFIVEMYAEKEGLLELGAHVLFPAALFLILHDSNLDEFVHLLLGASLIWLGLDMIFARTFKGIRRLEWAVRAMGALAALTCTFVLLAEENTLRAAASFGIFTAFFIIYTLLQRKAVYGYIPAAYLPLTIFHTLEHLKLDAWLPALTGLAILYFVIGIAIRRKQDWSLMLRNAALALGTILSLGALLVFKETGGWYALIVGLLFAAEMYLRRDGLFEAGMPVMFNIGGFLIVQDLKVQDMSYHLLTYSAIWLLTDMLAHLTFTNPRTLKWPVRAVGALLTIVNFAFLLLNGISGDAHPAAIGFGVYTILFLIISLIYRQPDLLYTFTATLPLFVAFLFREFEVTKWIHPVIVVAALYYATGYFLRRAKRASGWDSTLLFSGLGLGLIVSAAAPILGGVDAAIPVAIAASLWAVEAFARQNAWLGFPANILYLLAYFIILFQLKVEEPQFFSMGAALLGLIQHYLLTRAGSKAGAFIMGMLSQFILLGTTYLQMVNTEQLIYFVVLFFQSIAVIVYGIVVRSRSLTFIPIGFVVLGVVTVMYSALKGRSTVVLIGCTGVVLLTLGILAVLMRERITRLGERLSSWEA